MIVQLNFHPIDPMFTRRLVILIGTVLRFRTRFDRARVWIKTNVDERSRDKRMKIFQVRSIGLKRNFRAK